RLLLGPSDQEDAFPREVGVPGPLGLVVARPVGRACHLCPLPVHSVPILYPARFMVHAKWFLSRSRSEKSTNYDIYWMDIEMGKKARLTHAPGADVLPVFSPDGKKLMWTSTRTKSGVAQLFIADFTPPKSE